MADKEKIRSTDPVEKVERMNRIFDQLVLPMIIFTAIMAVVSAFILKPESCVRSFADDLAPVEDVQSQPDPYIMREVLLEKMEINRSIFELGGYTVVETEQSGLVAYCQLDEYTQIFDNIADSSGSRCSAVVYEKDGLSVTLRVYSKTIFLVEASDGVQTLSAVFRDEDFGTWTSSSDADAAGVLSLVPAQQLSGLLDMYEEKILSLVSGG